MPGECNPLRAFTLNPTTQHTGRIHRVTTNYPDLLSVLSNSALLSSLSPEELQTLAKRTVRKNLRAGEMLFTEGEPCHGLHIIARGKIRIFKSSAGGREQVLAINQPGESVAELPVFDGGNYPASAIAIEDTQIAFLAQREFRSYCMEHPEVALKLLAVVGARLRRLVAIIEELSFTTIRQRLVATLLRLSQNDGRRTASGIEFELPTTQQELANQLGTVRELVSRNLTRLQAEGLIEVAGRQIVVKDERGLSALVETN